MNHLYCSYYNYRREFNTKLWNKSEMPTTEKKKKTKSRTTNQIEDKDDPGTVENKCKYYAHVNFLSKVSMITR